MPYYPLFVNLEKKPCLVVGAGGVGRRKIRSLLQAGAGPVTILDTRPADADMKTILALGDAMHQCRTFEETDLDGKFLVFACTSDEKVNRRIANACAERGLLCNIADCPEKSSFIVPASVHREDMTLAVSTSGKSPALTKRIRKELQEHFGEEYSILLRLMANVRPLVLGLGLETKSNTAVFRALVNSPLLDALKVHDLDAAREMLEESLPKPLHANIPELLDGLV